MQPFQNISTEYRSSLVAKYARKPLPEPPSQIYLASTSSTSFESLLTHEIPAPFLYQNEEMSEVLSRISSSYADLRSEAGFKTPRRESSQTNTGLSGPLSKQAKSRPQSLLPPPPEYLRTCGPVDVVECRLSSTSVHSITPHPSPRQQSKRSVTPSLLTKLTLEIEEFTKSFETSDSSSLPPTTPPSLCYSNSSISTPEDPPSPIVSNELQHHDTASSAMMEFKLRSSSREASYPKSSRISTETSVRNISPSMPSPLHNGFDPAFNLSKTVDRVVNSTYQPSRPAPDAPSLSKTKEVSCIEWDDEEEKSRLTRMKKSITDLRSAGAGKLRPDAHPRKQHSAQRKLQFVEPPLSDRKVDVGSIPECTKKAFTAKEPAWPTNRSSVPAPFNHSRASLTNPNGSTELTGNSLVQPDLNYSNHRSGKNRRNVDLRSFPSKTRRRAVSDSAVMDKTTRPRTVKALSMPSNSPSSTSNCFNTASTGQRRSSGKSTTISSFPAIRTAERSEQRASLASLKRWWARWVLGCSPSSRKALTQTR